MFKKTVSINSVKSVPPGLTTKRGAFRQFKSENKFSNEHNNNIKHVYFNNFRKNDRRCFGCDSPYPHENGKFPAIGKFYSICNKINHFSRCCRQVKQSNVRNIN